MRYLQARAGFHVDQKGEFVLYDSLHRPIEKVEGKIVALMEGDNSFYAMIETERGVRPGRLA